MSDVLKQQRIKIANMKLNEKDSKLLEDAKRRIYFFSNNSFKLERVQVL